MSLTANMQSRLSKREEKQYKIHLFIQFVDHGVMELDVSPKYTIQKLKQQILQGSGLQSDHLILYFNERPLLNQNYQLNRYLIQNNSKLIAKFMGTKSGNISFSFNKLKHKVTKQFSKQTVPEWRLADKGLNLEARCNNKDCVANRKLVIINKGFGKFNIARIKDECVCPICKLQTEPAQNFGYYKTKILITGRRLFDSQINVKRQEEVNDERYHTFLTGSNKIGQWGYIEVQTTELPKN